MKRDDHPAGMPDPAAAIGRAQQRPRRGRHIAPRLRASRLAVLLMVCLVAAGAVAGVSTVVLPPKAPVLMADPAFDSAAFYQTRLPTRISRDNGRASLPGEPRQPTPPPPVAGLSQAQTYNAYIVVEVGRQMQLPKRAYIVAMVTVMQETNLRNLANPKVPASLKLPHEGTGTNYDSIGLFQQRPSQGWGTVAQLMDPSQSSARFYARLNRVAGWQGMSVGGAAQAVQRSAFPTAYAKHEAKATQIVNELLAFNA